MLAEAFKQMKIAFTLLVCFSILTGLIYPALVMGIAQLLFPWEANGSRVERNGETIGSVLIGQSFTDPAYFWGRPSSTTPYPYNAANSSGSNLGPSNPAFLTMVENRVASLQQQDPENKSLIPVDLVTASASGLDPDISPLAALYQIPRIAKARGETEIKIQALVQSVIKNSTFGMLGEPRLNVFELNLALDNLSVKKVYQ
jgi:potassium-transporting ATPase KdpC subunit